MNQEKRVKIQKQINMVFHNGTINRKMIEDILNDVRKLYAFDMVFVATNRKYKYQLDYLFMCTRENRPENVDESLMLTVAEFQDVLKLYSINQVCEETMPFLQDRYKGSTLHSAIMHNDNYYGTLGFVNYNPRTWTKDEKELIAELSMFLLLYLAVFQLDESQSIYEMQEKKIRNKNTISVFHLNLKNGHFHTVKLYQPMEKIIKEWDDYSVLVETYTKQFVDPIYGEQLKKRFNLEQLRKQLSIHTHSLSMDYPRAIDGKISWLRYSIELVSCDEHGNPEQALVFFDDITEESQKNAYYMHAVDVNHGNYAIIACVDLETEQYGVYVDNLEDFVAASKKKVIGNYRELLADILKNSIDPIYADHFNELFSFEGLKKHFENSSTIISYDFPYRFGEVVFWVRLEAVKTQNFAENGNKIMLYYTDITEQKNKEVQLKELSKSLKEEQQRAFEKELQAMTDPLTGAYNRMGYEKVIESFRKTKEPLGFIVIDVDNFKTMNDSYGHAFGDEMLVQVVTQLQSVFRKEDRVFRVGGDEFLLLLVGCKEDAWDSVQSKFAVIHKELRRVGKNKITITLSAGMCISENGYHDELPHLADEALYNTKGNGKVGLSQINEKHEILHEWNDDAIASDGKLKKPEIGNWRLEYTDKTRKTPKLFLNETACLIFGISNNLSPEECFETWYSHLPVNQKELIQEMVDKAAATNQTECTFRWKHPKQGEITVRSGGRYSENGKIKEINGYVVSITDTDVVLNYDDGQFLMQAMNAIYFCSYYINLSTKEYFIVKGHEDPPADSIETAFDEYLNHYVHPDYREVVRNFTDLSTLPKRLENSTHIDCEYLSTMKHGWCRSRFMPVKWDKDKNITHVLLVSSSIDKYKKEELEQERQFKEAMKLQLHISEIVSKSTVMQIGLMDKQTGDLSIWHHSEFGQKDQIYSFEQMKYWGMQNVDEKDASRFEEQFDLEFIKRKVAEAGLYSWTIRINDINKKTRTVTLYFENLQNDPDKFLIVVEDISDVIPKGIEWMRQFDLLEEVSEAIAIYDYENYDIVYMNKTARSIMNMDLTTLRTRKCYELFSDHDGPCTFCNKLLTKPGESGFMFRQITGTDYSSLIFGSIVEISGKKYRVEQAVPASQINSSVDELQKLLSDEQKLIDCVQHLQLMTDPNAALDYLMDQIVLHYDCDRACLVKVIEKQEGCLWIERCSDGIARRFSDGDKIPFDDFMVWEPVYSPINLRKVYCEVNPESEDEQQKWMRSIGIQNLMVLAFDYGNGQVGYLSIDNVRKNKEDCNWIGTLGFFIANQMREKELEK